MEKYQTCGYGKKRCKNGGKLIPTNKRLYSKITQSIKSHFKKFPSRYTSTNLAKLYRKKGGKYRCSRFGAELDSFYQGNFNSFLTPQVKKCLSVVYAPQVLATRFGKRSVKCVKSVKSVKCVKRVKSVKSVNADIRYLSK